MRELSHDCDRTVRSQPRSERAWKIRDLRRRAIRLVMSSFALMRGGYRDLLRYGRKDK
ncbi:DNA -binding domain-containing protein [Bradyrhizobium sp.]|uniref:DNA -binding domain-containing protein n=1 Tax=Bradyrhizobium sp. TaxID=376 RepID=UPI003C6B73E0